MKKILLISALAGLSFVSCKKDMTCTCTHTDVSGTSNAPGFVFTAEPPTTSKTTYRDIKKSNENAQMCKSDETTSSGTWTSGTNVYTYSYVTKNDCELTK